MSTIFKKIVFSCLALFAVISNANALSSNGSDGAFVVNGEVTLNVTDGQVFNFTRIDINSGGILNLVSSTPSSSFSMLASGDINIAGLLNVFTNTIFETPGNINISGIMDVKNQSTVSFSSNTFINFGNILFDGVPFLPPNTGGVILPNTGGEISVNPSFPPSSDTITITPVPEPSSYALLLSGIALINLARRKTFN